MSVCVYESDTYFNSNFFKKNHKNLSDRSQAGPKYSAYYATQSKSFQPRIIKSPTSTSEIKLCNSWNI